jgi:hypothetical protein
MFVGISDTILQEKHSFLYRNDLDAGDWLEISLEGIVANRDGFGSRIEVVFNGRTLIREVDGGSSFNSHHSSIVHFGLGDVSVVDTVRVIWPGGYTDEFYELGTNQHLFVTEQNGYVIKVSPEVTQPEFAFAVYPNPVTTNHLSVQFNSRKGGNYKLVLYDSMGWAVIEYLYDNVSVGSVKWEIDLPYQLSSEIYHLALSNEVDWKIKKLFVLK